MNIEKFTKLINKKFPNYDIGDYASELYYDFGDTIVANYMLFDDLDNNKYIVFVAQDSNIHNHKLFDSWNKAHDYFKDCVKLL